MDATLEAMQETVTRQKEVCDKLQAISESVVAPLRQYSKELERLSQMQQSLFYAQQHNPNPQSLNG